MYKNNLRYLLFIFFFLSTLSIFLALTRNSAVFAFCEFGTCLSGDPNYPCAPETPWGEPMCCNAPPGEWTCCGECEPPDPLPTPTPTPPPPTPTPSCVQTPGSYCCTICTSCNYSTNYYYNCDGSTYPSGGQFDSGCLYLCAATPTPVPSACSPPGSACGTCVAATCPDGVPCATGHTYCVWSATGNYCGPCITEVDNCATQCTGPAVTPTPGGAPTPTPGGGGPTCYTVDCWNNSEGTRCYVGEQYLSSASCSWNQCKSWNPSEYPQCRGNDGSCTVTGGCGGGPGPSTPTCNYDEVSLSVSPNPQNIGGSMTFSISGDASTWIEDSWSGGVDCSGAFPFSKTCNTTSVGSFTWTHYWKHCEGSIDNCSELCSETAPFTVIGYTISGNVFIDSNKNREKDSGESNYTGSITITSTGGVVSQPSPPDGSYRISDLPNNTSPTVSYTNGPPPGYELTYLGTASVTVGTACSTNDFQGASCDASDNIQNLNFGITSDFPWFQGKGGDMRLDNGFTDPIPTDLSTYASLPGDGETPGVIFSGDGSYNFCPGNSIGTCQDRASTTEWVVGGFTNPEVFTPVHSGIIRTSYEYIKTTARQSGLVATNLGTICNLTDCDLPSNFPNGFYTTDDLYLNSHTFLPDKDYVILVNGDLHIQGDVIVPTTSTVTFSVLGNIYVDKEVGVSDPSLTTPNLEGFYSTDGSFIIESYGEEDGVICNDVGTPRDKRLNMQGSIVVNAALKAAPGVDSFQNQRDLCTSDSDSPYFYIEERADFFLNAPELIKHPNFTWQEVAP